MLQRQALGLLVVVGATLMGGCQTVKERVEDVKERVENIRYADEVAMKWRGEDVPGHSVFTPEPEPTVAAKEPKIDSEEVVVEEDVVAVVPEEQGEFFEGCPLRVVARSPHSAAGNPCMNTEIYMREVLGLNDRQVAKVEKYSRRFSRLAH